MNSNSKSLLVMGHFLSKRLVLCFIHPVDVQTFLQHLCDRQVDDSHPALSKYSSNLSTPSKRGSAVAMVNEICIFLFLPLLETKSTK